MTYQDSATDQCVGWTQAGDRCQRTRAGIWRDDELYLCPNHVHQTPDASNGWKQALRSIRDHFDASTKVAQNISGAQVSESVYFAGDGKYIKIGTSLDPHKRISELRNDPQSAPHDIDAPAIELLAIIPGGFRVENRLHHRAWGWRVCGEWFTDDSELRELLADFGVPLNSLPTEKRPA